MSGAAAGAMAGILIANNIARLRAGVAAVKAAWKPLESRGYVPGVEKDRPILTGETDGVRCTVRIVADVVHNAHTEVSAVAAEMKATVAVYSSPGGLLSSIRDWLHQDIAVGDADFDRAFLVTGKPQEAAKSLLTPAIRERIVALAGTRLAGFTCAPGRAAVQLQGIETDTDAILVALELVAAAAKWEFKDAAAG